MKKLSACLLAAALLFPACAHEEEPPVLTPQPGIRPHVTEPYVAPAIPAEWGDEAERLLSSCTAVVCYNDEIATRVVSYLNRQGMSIPGDVAVVSFDNSQYSEMSIPRITSLSHGPYNVGRMAAELLFRHLRGESCSSSVAPWVLVEKESS